MLKHLVIGAALLLCALAGPTTADAASGVGPGGFGEGGRANVSFGSGDNTSVGRVAVAPDGKIIVVGSEADAPSSSSLVVARFQKDGSLDKTFGVGGKAITPVRGQAFASGVDVQADGKIVIGGGSATVFSNESVYVVARYNTNGTLDSGFGVGGVVQTLLDATQPLAPKYANSVDVRPDGKIVTSGSWSGINNGGTFAVARFTSSGALDRSFAAGKGWNFFAPPGTGDATTMQIQRDGKILLAGTGGDGSQRMGWIVRFKADGTLDTRYGNQGLFVGAYRQRFANGGSSINAIALANDKSVYAAGFIGRKGTSASVTHISKDGVQDLKFRGVGKSQPKGYVALKLGDGARAYGIAADSAGKVTFAGDAFVGGSTKWFISRIDKRGHADSKFGRSGIAYVPRVEGDDVLSSMAIQRDGKILLDGQRAGGLATLVRINKNGR
jgi:uncharacterized delta-60 repeat protein